MTSFGHVWELRGAWDVCTRCGATLDRLLTSAPCRGFVAPLEPRDGEQSPPSDEREVDHLRLEVARLQRVITNSASSIDGLLEDASEMGYQMHPRLVDALRWLARDLRAAPLAAPSSLDQGAAR